MAQSFAVGWRQVAIAFLLLSAAGMIAATYSVVAVPLAQEFGPSRMVLMLTMTVLSAVTAALMPFAGNLMDSFSLRKLMVVGGLSLAAGYLAISFATSFTQVLIIFGVLLAPANVLIGPLAITVLLSRWFVDRRGRAMGIAIAGISVGSFVFPFIIQGLLDANQWRDALRLLSLILLVWTVPAALLVVERPAVRGLHPDGASEPSELAKRETTQAAISVKAILTDPAFWMIAGTVAIVTSGLKGMITNLVPMAIDNGIDASTAAPLISIYAACGFTAKFAFAALSDRIGPRILMLASLGGFAGGMMILTQASLGYAVIAAGVGVCGLFGGLMVPTESYLAPRVFGQKAVGKAMGILSATILIALLATPPLFGLIFDLTGAYTGMFWTFAALALAALLWVPFIRLTPREVPPGE